MLALSLDCSTAALTTPQKVLPLWKLVELKMLDFMDRARTGISILTATYSYYLEYTKYFYLFSIPTKISVGNYPTLESTCHFFHEVSANLQPMSLQIAALDVGQLKFPQKIVMFRTFRSISEFILVSRVKLHLFLSLCTVVTEKGPVDFFYWLQQNLVDFLIY